MDSRINILDPDLINILVDESKFYGSVWQVDWIYFHNNIFLKKSQK